jgi:hypothetical protein
MHKEAVFTLFVGTILEVIRKDSRKPQELRSGQLITQQGSKVYTSLNAVIPLSG